MRKIKFRSWNEKSNRMDFWENNIPLFNLIEDGLPIMQYTGLKDKNGKEIYEGDLFQDEEDGHYNFVEWNDHFGGWGTNEWFLPKELVEMAQTLEIIGNIYENKELLK